MLGVQVVEDRVAVEIDFDGERTVSIILDPFVAGRNVVAGPRSGPPAGGDAHLHPVAALGQQVERAGLDDIPDVCGEGGDALVVAVVAFQAEAVDTVPVDFAVCAVIFPHYHFFGFAAVVIDPDFFLGVEFQRGVSATGKEQVLRVQVIQDRVASEIDFNVERTVSVVDDPLVAGRNVVAGPRSGPPTGGDAHLHPVAALGKQVECAVLDEIPDLCREGGDALVVAVVAFQAETIDPVPVDFTL